MTWLMWRQHRSQVLVTGVTLALFALAVLLTGVHMAHIYDDAVRNCPGNGACEIVGHLFSGYGAIVDVVHLSIALPVLLGVFVGSTLIARETEQATNVLVWTQTVTRRRWLLTKVIAAVTATVLTSAAVSALVTWWSGTPNSLYGDRFQGTQFDTQNIAPIAFALFAVALGLAAGSLIRRVLPALAGTVGVYAVIRIGVAVYLRPHYMTPVSASLPVDAPGSAAPGSWTLTSDLVDPAGHVVTGRFSIPATCSVTTDRTGLSKCLDRLGYHTITKYHPAQHYWQFQWTEAGLFLVLATALTIYAIVHTLHHDA
jgi:hypothetical protein